MAPNFFRKEEKVHQGLNSKELPSFIESVKDVDNIHIIHLKGPIDMQTIPEIEEIDKQAQEMRGTLKKNIILDFKQVTHVDSATCASLIEAISRFKSEHHKFVLVGLSDAFKSLIEITRIGPLFSIYETEEEAVKALESAQ